MWIFSKTGFVSIVEHRQGKGEFLLVRARVAEDIEELFAGLEDGFGHEIDPIKIECDRSADYWYRAKVRRSIVRDAINRRVRELDYDSHFKEAADKGDTLRHRAYMACWSAMNRFQTVHDRTTPDDWDEVD